MHRIVKIGGSILLIILVHGSLAYANRIKLLDTGK